jgi:hypothetical protein
VPAPSDQTSGGSPETTRPPIRPHPQRRKPRFGQTLLTHFIGTDRELAEQLLNDQVITTEHLTEAIFGQRNAVLEQLGPLLLDHGIDPEDIAALAGPTRLASASNQAPASTSSAPNTSHPSANAYRHFYQSPQRDRPSRKSNNKKRKNGNAVNEYGNDEESIAEGTCR